jgi:predicted ferric reductase
MVRNMSENQLLKIGAALLGLFTLLTCGFVLLVLQVTGIFPITHLLDTLFGLSTVQSWWYVTRAAGIVAYLLLWLSTAWGIMVSNKIADPLVPRGFTFDAHQFLSLLAIGFVVLHMVVLLIDQYLPFSVAEVLVPFIAPYRPVWVGIGIIGFYLTLLVTVTFYLRRWIGQKTFRAIHYLSFIAYAGATLHGWFSGTDTSLLSAQVMYAGSALVIVFLTVYRIVIARLGNAQPARVAVTRF